VSTRGSKLTLALLVCAVLLPPLLVYSILFREALAIPILDDYHAVIGFSLHLTQLVSVHDKLLYVIAAQHDEYKLIFEHAVMAAQLALVHHISFSFLVTLGNLMLLPIAYACWKNYFADETDLRARLALLFPVSFLLFQLNYAETLDWSMGSLQNVAVIAFSLLCLHFLTRPTTACFAMAWICSGLACASSANGFLLAPVGLLILWQQRSELQITVRSTVFQIAAWIALFPLMLGLYLYQYTRPAPMPHIALLWKALFFFSFTGGAVENMHGRPIPHLGILLGLAICAIFADSVRTRYRIANPFAFYSTVWIFLSAMLVASVRIALGLQLSLSGRYKIYCDLLLIFCYAYLAMRVRAGSISVPRRRAIYFGAASVIVLFSLASDVVGYQLLTKRRQRVLDGIALYLANPTTTTPMINPNETLTPQMQQDQAEALTDLNQARQSRLYALPGPPPLEK